MHKGSSSNSGVDCSPSSPPCGPDLAPTDFHLFGSLKEALRGRRVADDDELNHSVCEELRHFNKEFNATGIERLTQRWKTCINSEGDFVIILSETKRRPYCRTDFRVSGNESLEKVCISDRHSE